MKTDKPIVEAVASMTEFMDTYDKQLGYTQYLHGTYIDDVLYGLGVSLSDEYKFADGFAKFKADLKEHLK